MPRVSLTTLGCARNEVDSDELRARLTASGWQVVEDGDPADVSLVNTCGFIAAAKKDSIDTILDLSDRGTPVVAVGCLAERYGRELADELPEAAAVIGFDGYADLPGALDRVLAGESLPSHTPADRRRLLPLSPVQRSVEGTAGTAGLRRTVSGPVVPVKIASGCDRRCSFCAIPAFRGSFVSRRPTDVLDEIHQVVADGAREVLLVSENSTSYGKDLGDLRLLETLLPDIGGVPGLVRARLTYLQPAEIRPGLIPAVATTPGIAPYFDLSFQHASPTVLRRMRRFGGREDFLELISAIRSISPTAGIRSNVILGFPGETEDDVEILLDFLVRARLDAVGVFGYSDEDGTEAVHLEGHLDEEVISLRVATVRDLVDDLMWERATERIGEEAVVIVEACTEDDDGSVTVEGRAGHQGPEDGVTHIHDARASVGDVLRVRIVDVAGPDLIGACT